MTINLKPYSEYQNTQVLWFGEIPKHWSLKRNKLLFREKCNLSETGTENLLTVSQYTGVSRRRAKKDKLLTNAESLVGYKMVSRGNLVINIMLAWNGSLGTAEVSGIVSPAYAVFTCSPGIVPSFVHYLFRTKEFTGMFKTVSTGVVDSRLRLYPDVFLRLQSIVPPIQEQLSIVRYLNYIDHRIQCYINSKKKLIKLLEEQKQAIINKAVTKGIDPNVKMKPSGIEWLGDIPENFVRAKLGHLCLSIRDGTHNPPTASQGVHRLLSVRNIINNRFVIRIDDRTMTPEAFTELQRSYSVCTGDVVLALVGATTGKSAVVERMENVTVQRSIGILRPNFDLISSQYLKLVISSELVQQQIRKIIGKYAAQPGIYLADVASLQIVFPDVDTQQKIVSSIHNEVIKLDVLFRNHSCAIDLLSEYRTRLIFDVVTGKIDIREISSELPDVPSEDFPELDDSLDEAIEDLKTNEELKV